MKNDPMMDKSGDNLMDNGDNAGDGIQNDITEEYISQVSKASGDLIPEDFKSLSADIPSDLPDGERAAVLVTGTVEGGKIKDPQVATVDLTGNEENSPGEKLSEKFGATQEENSNQGAPK